MSSSSRALLRERAPTPRWRTTTLDFQKTKKNAEREREIKKRETQNLKQTHQHLDLRDVNRAHRYISVSVSLLCVFSIWVKTLSVSLSLCLSLSFVSKSLLAFALDFFCLSPGSGLVAVVASLCDSRVRLRFESFNLNVPSSFSVAFLFFRINSSTNETIRCGCPYTSTSPMYCLSCVTARARGKKWRSLLFENYSNAKIVNGPRSKGIAYAETPLFGWFSANFFIFFRESDIKTHEFGSPNEREEEAPKKIEKKVVFLFKSVHHLQKQSKKKNKKNDQKRKIPLVESLENGSSFFFFSERFPPRLWLLVLSVT